MAYLYTSIHMAYLYTSIHMVYLYDGPHGIYYIPNLEAQVSYIHGFLWLLF